MKKIFGFCDFKNTKKISIFKKSIKNLLNFESKEEESEYINFTFKSALKCFEKKEYHLSIQKFSDILSIDKNNFVSLINRGTIHLIMKGIFFCNFIRISTVYRGSNQSHKTK
jgi:hypothetical protein